MRQTIFTIVLAGTIIAESYGLASATFIDFDSHDATLAIAGKPARASIVTDDYADLGIVFGKEGVSSGAAVLFNISAYSGLQGLTGLDEKGKITPIASADIHFQFVDPVDGSSQATTDFVSFYLGDYGGDTDSWNIHVYDPFDNLIATRSVTSVAHVYEEFTYTNMHRFWVEWTAPQVFGYLLDDLSFNTPVTTVPEPGTFFLFGAGIAGLLTVARKR